MSSERTVNPEEVWEYYQKNKNDLESHMHLIAKCEEYGIEIFVTSEGKLPNIVVTADNEQVYEEIAISKSDCDKTAAKIYSDYLTSKVVSILSDYDDEDIIGLEPDDIIAEREDELSSATCEFVLKILSDEYVENTDGVKLDDAVEDIKEHILEYMARKHELKIYRPMYLEYEDGTTDISEYPYEEMVFDDEDNPIYRKES